MTKVVNNSSTFENTKKIELMTTEKIEFMLKRVLKHSKRTIIAVMYLGVQYTEGVYSEEYDLYSFGWSELVSQYAYLTNLEYGGFGYEV